MNQVSFRQRLCPDRLLGRMNATMRFVVWGVLPIGALIGGVLGAAFGLRTTLWVGALGQALAGVWLLASPMRTLRDFPDAPPERQEQRSLTTGGTVGPSGLPVVLGDADGWQGLDLVLGQRDGDAVVDLLDGADRNGDLLAAPEVALLQAARA